MYRTHWGLREAPFRTTLDPRFYYSSPGHEEALARLSFLTEEHRRLGICLGPTGSGKSLLLELFARQARRAGSQVVNISLLGVDLHEFLWLLASDLGLSPGRDESEFTLWRSILDRLIENRYQQLDTVILLDDADGADPAVLETLVRLCEADRTPSSRLTIVLATIPEQVRRLGERLLDLIELRIDLEPWEISDTIGYLNGALRQAGRQDPTFTEDAIGRLHRLCDGIPRRIAQMANLALLAGAGQRLQRIDAANIESVYLELGAISVAG
ncbi:MAG: AAA family ATPase [Planctomycetota bacterium]|nr:AAA family ATPase [Planctomycetota bacterium]